jgi:hypothetical protein
MASTCSAFFVRRCCAVLTANGSAEVVVRRSTVVWLAAIRERDDLI